VSGVNVSGKINARRATHIAALISRERGIRSENSGKAGRDRAEGKEGMLERETGDLTIKSDFQSSVNVYDFQGANYRAKSEGMVRSGRGVSRD